MRTLHRNRALGMLALLVVALTTAGCAALAAGAARHKYVNEQTQAHVYNMPITTVWPNVRTLLFEKGYETKSSDTGGSFSLETEPKLDNGESIRYLAQGVKIDDKSCRIEITKATVSPTRTHSERDLEMEWALLEKIDATSASKISADADAAGEAAKNK
jgi:hypothetical protein